ncbi:MAG: hypothetical protein DWQ34_06340 [Planctomycetota bacterium]|nr:MAG: hypothetical protein DWQ29_09320 [Planctomycetota bacterium]REJ95321.1 MAG: hypothetical protein DWQ34_06340 [Planctomycetota bacterium]REK24238.1 MAG: hypothetical protein DWQ41_14485 [Planctomycetota bacterium]REK28777.1 MAG: hypothetical protein DWQ45_24035 [Planctomycetota bacterium]
MATDVLPQTTPTSEASPAHVDMSAPIAGGRGMSSSSLLLCIFGVCGLAFGAMGDTGDGIVLYTMLGAAVGITLGFCAQALME